MKLQGSRAEMVQLVRTQIPAGFSVFLGFGNIRIEVACDRKNLSIALSDYFQGFSIAPCPADVFVSVHEDSEPRVSIPLIVKAPDSGKDKEKEAYADIEGGRLVKKVLTGMVFIFGGEDHVAVGPCAENPNQVVNFILNRVISHHLLNGCLLAHAAAVAVDKRGIILAGFSGRGKSSLALHLVCDGADFVSNDRLLIKTTESGLAVHGIAKLPRINPGTVLSIPKLNFLIEEDERTQFSSYSPEALWCLEQKYDVPINGRFGKSRFVLDALPKALVVLNWRFGDSGFHAMEIDLKRRPDVVSVIAKEPGLFFLGETRAKKDVHSDYVTALSKIPVYELTGGVDFDRAVRLCRRILDSP